VNPLFYDALYNMACTYASMGNKEQVSNTLSKLIKLNASYKEKISQEPLFKDYAILYQ